MLVVVLVLVAVTVTVTVIVAVIVAATQRCGQDVQEDVAQHAACGKAQQQRLRSFALCLVDMRQQRQHCKWRDGDERDRSERVYDGWPVGYHRAPRSLPPGPGAQPSPPDAC